MATKMGDISCINNYFAPKNSFNKAMDKVGVWTFAFCWLALFVQMVFTSCQILTFEPGTITHLKG
jgi:hypothetical protein